ncbi:MAG: ABC transporter ATP-binding protein [Candidatus Dormiibacterota bacterium]
MSVAEPLLQVEAMTCSYGSIVAVRDLSFRLDQGEIVALLGPNGAGKSTALRAISGMRRAQKGSITFDGSRIERWSSDRIARAGMALVPEGRRLFTELSVEENLRMGGWNQPRPALDERINEMRGIFPILQTRAHQRAGTLSGGEQQQLAIARALVSRPKALLIDEMSLGLSPLVVADLYRTVRAINEAGTAVLLVEQQVALARTVAQRIYLVERGQVKDEGPAAKFRDVGSVTGSYLGEVGAASATAQETAGIATERPVEVVRLPLRRGQARALQVMAQKASLQVGDVVAEAIETLLTEPPATNGSKPTPRAARKPRKKPAPRGPKA